MKKHIIPSLILAGALSPLLSLQVQAADYVLRASDGSNTSSFTSPFTGSPGGWATAIGGANVGAPSAGNTYTVNYSGAANWDLRTPADGNSYTFAGDSLTINATSGTATANTTRFLLLGSAARTITVDNLILNGGYVLSSGGNITETLAGNINLSSTTTFGSSAAARILNVASTISGAGTLNFSGGAVTLSGSNSYSGGTTINAGNTAVFTVTGAYGLGTGPLTINGTGGGTPTVTLSTAADTTLASLSGTGNSILNGGGLGRLLIVNQTTSGTYEGQIRGGYTSFVLGSLSTGTLTLTNDSNAYQGTTTVNAGTLIVGNGATGKLTNSGTVTVNAGTLGGALASGNNFVGAVVIGNNDGTGDAILTGATRGTAGRIASAGNLTFNSDAKFVFDLVSTAEIVASDLFVVNGGAGTTLINSGALIDFVFTGDSSFLTLGQTFTAIDGGSFAGNAGVFSNLAEGGLIASNGVTLQASYSGGDLVFTVVPEPASIAFVAGGIGMLLMLRRRQCA